MESHPSIAPERLLRALLLQAFYTIRSERQGLEQLQYNLLYRWLVGLGVDDPGAACRQSAKTASGELLEPPPLPSVAATMNVGYRPGKSCPSLAVIGQWPVTYCEDWY